MILKNTDAPYKDFPYLKAKASETKHLVPIIVELIQSTQDGTAEAQHKLQAAQAIHQFCKLLDTAGPVPTEEEATSARDSMQRFLTHYTALHVWADRAEKKLFHVVPKFHMAWHMAQRFRFLNPRYAWTFKCEDYVGKISKLAHGCTYGTARMSVSQSICSKYRWCMHLRLSRGDFMD